MYVCGGFSAVVFAAFFSYFCYTAAHQQPMPIYFFVNCAGLAVLYVTECTVIAAPLEAQFFLLMLLIGLFTGLAMWNYKLHRVCEGEPQAQCARSATIWASGRTRDPYFEILGAPRGIMVTPSGGFARCSTFGSRHGKA